MRDGACPEPELEAPAAENVERRGHLRHHGGRAQGQVRDVREEGDASRVREQRGDECERVDEAALVGVVLDTKQVVLEAVGQPRGLEHAVRIAGVRDQEVAESISWP
jgi:hypothetical protein